ncbi:TPA: 30S ribosomal protein S20 [candidate division CPR2 bacterium]|uniref:Small ribosomal subunit protein bS20 n=1 Tax=candidate division CPR2 bacterium GW2011_GWC1_41_48 TaxID=1618344 RepID=A0A0G0W8P3_UNCC2|nr:MAG: 30S ribosomal protein S20 [candidate division CPR2 bacterium GW2011_GWC2_39_35]KKR28301.1 MAG: 30S ribosomal protein S20 [candidate division CPR2 bacterium GW2011_GWD2_39_7]KKR28953.1 MAG: 30S ribosomal protein S20 [candidate division CPR2 bacterium GW2011_GWD1_39_7]KKS09364.1 MAG: 30S ribosomal protein S20 [candidate division CPR2 bacterium GW2011_GWC1_41_48]OGB61783.1 MAG: 30S ribosomal protein S20 [candidate division CPR2 bacterium GWD1_39_7]OGB72442.1 MAG: 30S ribosomal protein S20
MPITKSAIKKARQDEVRRLRNKTIKVSFRSKIKAAREAVQAGDLKSAENEMQAAYSALDKAAKKGVIHQNAASRKKSRLAQLIALGAPVKEKKVTKKPKAKTTKKAA